eukprot:GDKI01020409.1.p1 GENE.GDKI01020409.1~~GDKI01020409.1.p1  ORF type:complete len:748 (-),score=215.91 GDKI01020409.1:73-2316(-)
MSQQVNSVLFSEEDAAAVLQAVRFETHPEEPEQTAPTQGEMASPEANVQPAIDLEASNTAIQAENQTADNGSTPAAVVLGSPTAGGIHADQELPLVPMVLSPRVNALSPKSNVTTALELPPCKPVSLEFQDLKVQVRKRVPQQGPPCMRVCKKREGGESSLLTILKGVSGKVTPGTLVAVMGASGAGKSTLLNVLARRITPAGGSVTYNGKPLDHEYIRRSAYVQQEDMFFPNLTVREHLNFQAALRLPKDMKHEKKQELVNMLVQRLGLGKCQHNVIGNIAAGGPRGISGGERKRLAFATEIITNPSVLFCDEPTSGLDSFMAQSVVEVMKELAAAGRTVVATIHQPSSEIYAMFDKVMFLGEGKMIYYGDREHAIEYFRGLGYPCPTYSNPADFFIRSLACMYGDTEKQEELEMLASKWAEYGKLRGAEEAKRDELSPVAHTHQDSEWRLARESSRFATGWLSQFAVLWQRATINTRRDPVLFRARLGQSVVLGLIMGLVYIRLDNTQTAVQSRNGAIFFLLINQSMLSVMGVLQTFPVEKPIAQREYEAGAYSITAYYMAKTSSDLPFQLVFPSIFISIVYWLIGLNDNAEAFFKTLLFVVLTANASISIGYMVSAAVSSVAVALAIGPVILLPFILFGGFLINLDDIADGWKWLEYMSFFKYGFSGAASSVWGTDYPDLKCPILPNGKEGNCFHTGQEVMDFLSITTDNFGRDIGCLLAIIVGLRTLGLILLYRNTVGSKQNA